MRQLAGTLRRRPAPLLGTLLAVMLGSIVVVISASFIGTGATTAVPPDQLAGAAVVVTGRQDLSVRIGRGPDGYTDRVPLPGRAGRSHRRGARGVPGGRRRVVPHRA